MKAVVLFLCAVVAFAVARLPIPQEFFPEFNCPDLNCPSPQYQGMTDDGCHTCTCCSVVLCRMHCPYGMRIGNDGCPSCECRGNINVHSNPSGLERDENHPAAHLMGGLHNPELNQPPGRQFSVSNWIYDQDLAFTSSVTYRHGRIVISVPGLYYVYSQVSFLERSVQSRDGTVSTESPSLSHYLYRYNIIYPNGGEEKMIQNSITKCLDMNKSFGEYTSYLGAVMDLRRGDEIFVKVSNLTMLVRDPKSSYFGLFKI